MESNSLPFKNKYVVYEKSSAGETLRGHVMWFKDGQRLISQPGLLVEWNLHIFHDGGF